MDFGLMRCLEVIISLLNDEALPDPPRTFGHQLKGCYFDIHDRELSNSKK